MHTSMLLLDYLLPINLIIFSDRPDKNNQLVKMALQPTMDAPDFKGENFCHPWLLEHLYNRSQIFTSYLTSAWADILAPIEKLD